MHQLSRRHLPFARALLQVVERDDGVLVKGNRKSLVLEKRFLRELPAYQPRVDLGLVGHFTGVDGEGVGAAVAQDQGAARVLGSVGDRGVGGHRMHEDDGAGVARNRDGERFIDIFGDAALEEAVSTVREQVVPVAARDDLEAAVFDCGVVEVEQDAYRAAVGQRIADGEGVSTGHLADLRP